MNTKGLINIMPVKVKNMLLPKEINSDRFDLPVALSVNEYKK
jgi:hypothetical protein